MTPQSQCCATCAKRAPKLTRLVWPQRDPQLFSADRTRYLGNDTVIKESRSSYDDASGHIVSMEVWDGKTYAHKYEPFCTLRCAYRFAVMAFRSGTRAQGGRP